MTRKKICKYVGETCIDRYMDISVDLLELVVSEVTHMLKKCGNLWPTVTSMMLIKMLKQLTHIYYFI